MSHMAVLVNTQTLDESELRRVLQPYHEFECTGVEDEFVRMIDETDDRREQYLENTTRVYRFPDGTVEDYYAPEFMRQISEDELMRLTNGDRISAIVASRVTIDGKEQFVDYLRDDEGRVIYGPNRTAIRTVHFDPPGGEETLVPTHTLKTFVEWCCDYCGCNAYLNDKKVYGDSKNGKKYGYVEVTDEKKGEGRYFNFTNPNKKWDWWAIGGRYEGRFPGGQNRIRVGDIDFDAAIADLKNRYASDWNSMVERLGPPESMAEAQRGTARFIFGVDLEKHKTIEEHVAQVDGVFPLTAWAIVDAKNGWREKAEMGWWGLHGEERGDWDEMRREWFAGLDPDSYLTYVDCHI